MRYWQSDRNRPRKRKKRKVSSGGSRRSITSGGSLRNYPFLRSFYQHQAEISVGFQKFFFFLAIASLLYVFIFGEAGTISILALKQEKAMLAENLAILVSDTEKLQKEINSLKDEPFKMEQLGRERYGYIYPGDRVYKIIYPQKLK
ncbi:MAG: septum formation initiator family protein [Candidatus Krumholzibacteria bacterium]